jgi:hypothetical protein
MNKNLQLIAIDIISLSPSYCYLYRHVFLESYVRKSVLTITQNIFLNKIPYVRIEMLFFTQL